MDDAVRINFVIELSQTYAARDGRRTLEHRSGHDLGMAGRWAAYPARVIGSGARHGFCGDRRAELADCGRVPAAHRGARRPPGRGRAARSRGDCDGRPDLLGGLRHLAISFWPHMIPFVLTIDEAAAPQSSLA